MEQEFYQFGFNNLKNQLIMDTNEKTVKMLWCMCNSIFAYSTEFLNDMKQTKEIRKFSNAYYDFMHACNELYIYAEKLPF